MQNIFFVALCAISVISEAVQRNPNHQADYKAARVLQQGEDPKKPCGIRTITYLTSYNPAHRTSATGDSTHTTNGVDPYENGYGYATSSHLGNSEVYSASSQVGSVFTIRPYPFKSIEDPYQTEGPKYPQGIEYVVGTDDAYSHYSGHSAHPPHGTQGNGGHGIYHTSESDEEPLGTSTIHETVTFATSVPVTLATTLTITTAIPTTIFQNNTATVTSFSISTFITVSTFTSISTFTTVSPQTVSATITSTKENVPTSTTTSSGSSIETLLPSTSGSSTDTASTTTSETSTSGSSAQTVLPATSVSSTETVSPTASESSTLESSLSESSTETVSPTASESSTEAFSPTASESSTELVSSGQSTSTLLPPTTLGPSSTDSQSAGSTSLSSPSSTSSMNPLKTFDFYATGTLGGAADGLTLGPQMYINQNGPAIFRGVSGAKGFSLDPTTNEVRTTYSDIARVNLKLCCTYSIIGSIQDPATCDISSCNLNSAGKLPLQCAPDPNTDALSCFLNVATVGGDYSVLQIIPFDDEYSSQLPAFQLAVGTTLGAGYSPVTLRTQRPAAPSFSSSSSLSSSTIGRVAEPTSGSYIYAFGSGTDADHLPLQPQLSNSGLVVFSTRPKTVVYRVAYGEGQRKGVLHAYSKDGSVDQRVCCTYANAGNPVDPASCFIGTCSLGGDSVAPLECTNWIDPKGHFFFFCGVNATSINTIYGVQQVALLPDDALQFKVGSTLQPGNKDVTLLADSSGLSAFFPASTSTSSSSMSQVTTPPTTTFAIFAADTGIDAANGLALLPQSTNTGGSLAVFGSPNTPVTYSLNPVTKQVSLSPGIDSNRDICCTYRSDVLGTINPAICSIATCSLGDTDTAPLQCSLVAGGSGVLRCFINAISISAIYRTPQIAVLADGTYQLEIGTALGANNSPVTLSTVRPT
ncbi:hypothetical protein JX265_009809 [Neoarthrinium moseri]|uniref:Uncharacterized protein n=1 Tax=Neoarthrinium moseri TaxID=1658444 RepID=A0A9P9WF15_9PEZI|nr:hypothetical protein JX265_009809 [Neoarthrinium moseri]